jgi:hypothetical protein
MDAVAHLYVDGEMIANIAVTQFSQQRDFHSMTYQLEGIDMGLDLINQTKNNMEEKEEMVKCEFKIGDVFVVQDEFYNIDDAEVVLVCPGYKLENFEVTQTPKGVRVVVESNVCVDCGGIDTEEFFFEFNENFEVVDVKHNVRDGLFILQAIYDFGMDVEVDENL